MSDYPIKMIPSIDDHTVWEFEQHGIENLSQLKHFTVREIWQWCHHKQNIFIRIVEFMMVHESVFKDCNPAKVDLKRQDVEKLNISVRLKKRLLRVDIYSFELLRRLTQQDIEDLWVGGRQTQEFKQLITSLEAAGVALAVF